jgi:shikimate kinase
MGSGKTTYGRQLAEELKWNFIDLDAEIEKAEKKSIADIFASGNEETFRKLEAGVLRDTAQFNHVVISTGGGAAAWDENMEWMNRNGKTVYLKLFETDLVRRLSSEQENRHLIKDLEIDQIHEFVHRKLRERAPFYTQAQIVIDPLSLDARELAHIIAKELI